MKTQKIGRPIPIKSLDLEPVTPDALSIVGDFQRVASLLLGFTGDALVPVAVSAAGLVSVADSVLATALATVNTNLGIINTTLGTTLGGKLDTLHTDIDTTLSGQLETNRVLLVSIDARLSFIQTDIGAIALIAADVYQALPGYIKTHETA